MIPAPIDYVGIVKLFTNWELMNKLEDRSTGLSRAKQLTEGWPDINYFLMGIGAIALWLWQGQIILQEINEWICNDCLSSGCNDVRNAFGTWLGFGSRHGLK